MLDVSLNWNSINGEDDPRWSYLRAVYAYIAPEDDEILYIGKADVCSVRRRWREKEQFWRDLERERKIFSHARIVADLLLPRAATILPA